ncbi:MAG: DNA polymerase IV [Deferrisomatales bacterium]|nr:DNA polymerase IV [Deferrisomatales bacterium]
MSRTILHVDMDAFYASVEQLDRPEHRGRPVVVGADPKEGRGRGVVAACSYEARTFGIRSALPISQAWRLCPGAVYLRPRPRRYAEVSEAVFRILGRYTDRLEPLSIDEAFLDVTGSDRLFGGPAAIGQAIKEAVRRELGLVASVGAADSKFVAKVASDLEKPDGFVVVPPGRAAAFLAPLPIRRLWGVGPRTAERLSRVGLRTIGEVAALRPGDLEGLLGEAGEHLWRLARGEDDRPVEGGAEAKSLGAETTFEEDVFDPEEVRRTLLELADRVAWRLRRRGLRAGGLTLKLRGADFVTHTRAAVLPLPTDLGEELFRGAVALLDRVPWRSKPVRLVGVTATRLTAEGAGAGQLDLFAAPGGGRQRELARALDALGERFGAGTVTRAALVGDRPAKG